MSAERCDLTPRERIAEVLHRVRTGQQGPAPEFVPRPCDPPARHHQWISSNGTPADEARCVCGEVDYGTARAGLARWGGVVVESWQVVSLPN